MGFVGGLISAEFAETDVSRGFVNGFNFNCTPAPMLGPTRWASSAAFARPGGGSIMHGSVVTSATVSAPSPSATICPSPYQSR